ncbi:hypothetical protein [Dysgonomonas macrotermitis]|uniref:Cleaved Adhesin Domain n=1 Tax=Dysgonomonas macrotermitis TaxID=1346286 RepID=A0A1M5IKX4_9BACT|nr:hypothetical protein [Dysgonomonas macrotermitis]SHG28895.1 hypothetical protein SAMN05444362_12024 [Dysgonomonas macrotermitis]
MKKKILLLMGVFLLGITNAQVGINTQNPLGVFHIDPKGDTSAIGVNDLDDFIVTNDGKVGIGTSNPQTTLDVNGSMRYSDGTEFDGYILRSIDGLGNAYWSEQRLVNQMILPDQTNIESIVSNTIYNITNGNPHYMGVSITIPEPGIWKLFFKANYRQYVKGNKAYYILWYLSASSTANTNIEKAFSSYSGSAFDSRYIIVTSNCTFLITTTTANTKLYLWAEGFSGTMTTTEFNIPYVTGDGFNFWALPMN